LSAVSSAMSLRMMSPPRVVLPHGEEAHMRRLEP
jgi:hypothetical protein